MTAHADNHAHTCSFHTSTGQDVGMQPRPGQQQPAQAQQPEQAPPPLPSQGSGSLPPQQQAQLSQAIWNGNENVVEAAQKAASSRQASREASREGGPRPEAENSAPKS